MAPRRGPGAAGRCGDVVSQALRTFLSPSAGLGTESEVTMSGRRKNPLESSRRQVIDGFSNAPGKHVRFWMLSEEERSRLIAFVGRIQEAGRVKSSFIGGENNLAVLTHYPKLELYILIDQINEDYTAVLFKSNRPKKLDALLVEAVAIDMSNNFHDVDEIGD